MSKNRLTTVTVPRKAHVRKDGTKVSASRTTVRKNLTPATSKVAGPKASPSTLPAKPVNALGTGFAGQMAPGHEVSRAQSAVHELDRLLRLSDEDRAWLTERFEAGESVTANVTSATVAADVDEEGDESQLSGAMTVDVAHREEDGFWRELGSFELGADWPVSGGRYSDLHDDSDAVDTAVGSAADSAGFSLINAGVEDGSGSGYFARTYELSPR